MKTVTLNREEIYKRLGKKFSISNILTFNDSEYWVDSVSEFGSTPLMYVLQYNLSHSLNLSKAELLGIISKSDLKAINNENGKTALMDILRRNRSSKLDFSRDEIIQFANLSDLDVADNWGMTALAYLLNYNHSENINFTPKDILTFMKSSKTQHIDGNGKTALMLIIENNRSQQLNFSTQDFLEAALVCGDINDTDRAGRSALSYLFEHNKNQELNLSRESLIYLITEGQGDFKIVDMNDDMPLGSLIKNNHREGLNFTREDIMSIISKTYLDATAVTNQHYIHPTVNTLKLVFENNRSQRLHLEREDIIKIMNHIDKIEPNNSVWLTLLEHNNTEQLGITKTDILGIIKNRDLSIRNFNGDSLLTIILQHNRTQKLNLKREDILDIIYHSDLNTIHRAIEDKNILMFLLENNAKQELGLTKSDLFDIIKKTNLDFSEYPSNKTLLYVLKYCQDFQDNGKSLSYGELYDVLDLLENKSKEQDTDSVELIRNIKNIIRQNSNVLNSSVTLVVDEELKAKDVVEKIQNDIFNHRRESTTNIGGKDGSQIGDSDNTKPTNKQKIMDPDYDLANEDSAIAKLQKAGTRLKQSRDNQPTKGRNEPN